MLGELLLVQVPRRTHSNPKRFGLVATSDHTAVIVG